MYNWFTSKSGLLNVNFSNETLNFEWDTTKYFYGINFLVREVNEKFLMLIIVFSIREKNRMRKEKFINLGHNVNELIVSKI